MSYSLSADQIQTVIAKIYDAALDKGQWLEMLQVMSKLLGAEQGIMRVITADNSRIISQDSFNKSADWNKQYKEYYHRIDPYIPHFQKRGLNVLGVTEHLFDINTFRKTQFHADFLKPQNILHAIGGCFTIDPQSYIYLAMHRSYQQGGFGDSELESIRLLVPHLKKARLLNQKLQGIEIENKLFRDSLNQINSALLLVNRDAEVIYINARAELVINQTQCLSIKQNRLSIGMPDVKKRLDKLISGAIGARLPKQIGTMQYRDPVMHSISILVSPVNPDQINHEKQYVESALIVLSPSQQSVSYSATLLASLYQLSPSESRLAEQLCYGLALDQIAEKFSVSKNTLRTQLRSIFTKIGVSRQVDLVNLIKSGPAGLINLR